MTTTLQTTLNDKSRPLWQLFFGIIDRPVATFRAIVAQPGWLIWAAPLLVLILSLAVLLIVQTPHTLVLAQEQMENQLATMPEDQAEAARAGMEMTMSLPFMLATGIGFGTLALVLATLAQATFLYFTALVSGGETTFGAMFKMSVWSRLPMALGALAQAGFIAVAGRMIQYPGLSFFVASGNLMQNAGNPLFVLLSGIDLFWLWHLLLVVLGVSVTARFGRGKSLLLTLLYAVLFTGVTVLPTLLFGGMMAG
ncbi:MAG TPA: YIP1 family protein [Anaerolineae bacterium]|nr:YIP1 family protein [Anaerolineae bacterium]